MAIDRTGVAWLFANPAQGPQKLYKVNTSDASCASDGAVITGQSYSVTGSVIASSPEQLYLSVSNFSQATDPVALADLDAQSLTNIRPITNAPVGVTNSPMAIAPNGQLVVQVGSFEVDEVNPANAQVMGTHQIPFVVPEDKWYQVFAFWGGDLYFFASLSSTSMFPRPAFRVSLADWSGTQVVNDLGVYVFAATSGTCAPTFF